MFVYVYHDATADPHHVGMTTERCCLWYSFYAVSKGSRHINELMKMRTEIINYSTF